MATGFVKVTLLGNLGKDPEVRFTGGGTAVANLRVACTERVKVQGEWQDQTEWVSLVVFGKTAENCGQYLSKGRQIYAEGRLQTREWTDKEGNKRYSTEVIANQVIFVGGNPERQGSEAPARREPAHPSDTRDEAPPLSDDDIPF